MSFSVGIVGLPNVGKSTLFQELTKKPVDIADYPFTTIHPNIGIVQVPDKRLEKIAQIVKPEKITPTVIEFIDIAGLVKDAHKGKGLGNQFLEQIKNCDAIAEVINCFRENINPEADIETIRIELEAKGLDKKPIIYVYNINSSTSTLEPHKKGIKINLKSPTSQDLDKLILECYNILDLITFYTIKGGKETRAWTLKKGSRAPEAGFQVHSDFEKKFIKAEVVNWQKLIEAGSWLQARKNGLIKIVGKDYTVQDGDVIEFKI